jgi:hypothetical protein
MIYSNLDRLCILLDQAKKTRSPLGLNATIGAFTSDVVTEFAFGKSYGLLDVGKEDEREQMSKALKISGVASHTLKQWPWLVQVFDSIPYDWISWISPDFGLLLGGQEVRVFISSTTKFVTEKS